MKTKKIPVVTISPKNFLDKIAEIFKTKIYFDYEQGFPPNILEIYGFCKDDTMIYDYHCNELSGIDGLDFEFLYRNGSLKITVCVKVDDYDFEKSKIVIKKEIINGIKDILKKREA